MKRKLMIGVITTDNYDRSQVNIMTGIIDQAFKSNSDVVFLTSLHNFYYEQPNAMTERLIFRFVLSDQFDGFIYNRNTFANIAIREEIDDLLIGSGKPVMLIDADEHGKFDVSESDDRAEFSLMIEHLIIEHGFKNIYCLTGYKDNFNAEERLKGYHNTMEKYGLEHGENCWSYGDFWKTSAVVLADRIASGELKMPDAVACANDVMADTLIRRLNDNGFRVPEDIAVTGFDPSDRYDDSGVSLTTYERANYLMGAVTFRRLYRKITGTVCPRVHEKHGKLILGRSCGCTDKHNNRRLSREGRQEKAYQYHFEVGEVLPDMMDNDTLPELSEVLNRNTYFIRQMSHIQLCLTENYCRSLTDLQVDLTDFMLTDSLYTLLDQTATEVRKPSSCNSVSAFLKTVCAGKKLPSAYYISPLCFKDRFFGFSALSFGKNATTYKMIYAHWLKYVCAALEQIRIKSALRHKVETMSSDSSLIGLLDRDQLDTVYRDERRFYIHIELMNIGRLQQRGVNEVSSEITRAFPRAVAEILKDDQPCGMISSFCCGIAAKYDCSEAVFSALSEKIKAISEALDNVDISFTVGLCSDAENLGDAIKAASANQLYYYSTADTIAARNLGDIYKIRRDMYYHPERQWNVEDIAAGIMTSRGNLQRLYKEHFGCGIIEDLTVIRLGKAKALLRSTELSIADIAEECGYSSYGYFVRQFKKNEGMLPNDYRQKYHK